MWIFTPEGFVSAVEDRNDPTTIMVRARDHHSLVVVCDILGLSTGRIKAYEGTDYPYRIAISHAQLEAYVVEAARGVVYPNFKDEAKHVRGEAYANVLGRVWSAGLALTPSRVRRRQHAVWDRKRAERAERLGPLAFMR